MSKKRKLPFAIGGIVAPPGLNDMSGEMVITKEERERLAKVIKSVSTTDVVIPASDFMKNVVSKIKPGR